MRLITKATNFDFMQHRQLSGKISIGLVLLSLVCLFTFKLNFGLDFTGGTLLEIGYKHPADLEKIKKVLKDANIKSRVNHYGQATDVQIFITPQGNQQKGKFDSEKMMALLKPTSDQAIVKRRFEFVGSAVGDELVENGGLALLTALFCILLYVGLRFEPRFAVGSVVALIHDVLIILGIFSITRIEFDLSVLAALLAVIGYSLNDTIVVFDRIRENFRKIRKGDSVHVVNISINETLSRTIMTSFTTLVVLLALLFLGGEIIRGFSIALILGVIVGTYSSIFVASNAVLKLGVTRADMLEVKKEGAGVVDDRP